jgi:hypothetical protein
MPARLRFHCRMQWPLVQRGPLVQAEPMRAPAGANLLWGRSLLFSQEHPRSEEQAHVHSGAGECTFLRRRVCPRARPREVGAGEWATGGVRQGPPWGMKGWAGADEGANVPLDCLQGARVADDPSPPGRHCNACRRFRRCGKAAQSWGASRHASEGFFNPDGTRTAATFGMAQGYYSHAIGAGLATSFWRWLE